MRTKSQVQADLDSALSSDRWQRIKNGLVGQELISLGTEIIYSTEQVASTLVNNFNPNYADYPSLITLATANSIPVSKCKPSTIRIQLPPSQDLSAQGLPTIFDPFSLYVKSGSITFYNVEYCTAGTEITLYQGTPTVLTDVITDNMNMSDEFLKWPVNVVRSLEINFIPTTETTVQSFYRLSDKALPDSVYFLKMDKNTVSVVPRFDSISYSSEKECFQLRTLSDGVLSVFLGDGFWGKSVTGTNFAIYYLNLTNNIFSASSKVKYGDKDVPNCRFLSSSAGDDNSLEYARQCYWQEQRAFSSLTSIEQVRDYVLSHSSVEDCCIQTEVSSGVPVVTIYWKPVNPDDYKNIEEGVDFPSDLITALRVRSFMATEYRVRMGKPVNVGFYVDFGPQAVSQEILTQIRTTLLNNFVNMSLGYLERVNLSVVAEQIKSTYGIIPIVYYCSAGSVSNTSVTFDYNIVPGTFSLTHGGKSYTDNMAGVIQDENGVFFASIVYPTGFVSFSSTVVGDSYTFASTVYKGDNTKYMYVSFDSPVVVVSQS